jgi:hypothetical protein
MKQELMYQYKQLLFMKFWNWKRVILVIEIFDRDMSVRSNKKNTLYYPFQPSTRPTGRR